MKILVAAFVVLGVGAGCSTTIAAHRPLSDDKVAEVNESLEGHRASVIVAAEPVRTTPLDAKNVKVGRETSGWLEKSAMNDWRPTAAPTTSLKKVSVWDHGTGALEGLGFGVAIGAVTGSIVGSAVASSASLYEFSPQDKLWVGAGAGAVAGAVLGALMGTIIGAAVGHRTTIEFDDGAPLAGGPTE
jgi:hypothetical protein